MFLKFKKAIFHEGTPIAEGEIKEFSEGDGWYYVGAGIAEKTTPPRPKKRAQATSKKAAARETRRST